MKDSTSGVRQVDLPPDAKAHCTLSRLDYTDAFVVDTAGGRHVSAEQWARTILEDAPLRFQRTAPWAWRALGLERGSLSSTESILSWPIKSRSDDMVLLSASGHLGMSAELLVEQRSDGLLFSTMIELRNRAVRLEWAAITPTHQRIVRDLLLRARRTTLGRGSMPGAE